MEKIYFNESFKKFLHGGDYNPEQWEDTPEVWDEDMRLFRLAHCNEMSVGIFSWAKLEPEEGVYRWEWMDTILDKIYAAGGRVLLATPSGARPRWMAEKYPEVLRVNENGTRNAFGIRHNHCFTSPVYREKTFEMNAKLAARYGRHPAVIGWHVSNEYNGTCYCPLCRRAFSEWLRRKYHNDIHELNVQWWHTFWSHTADDFDQILPPMPNGEKESASLILDWRRFITDQTVDFMKHEIAGLRTASDLPVTTNMMGLFNGLNYQKFADALDAISWDNYPTWHSPKQEEVALWAAMAHDLMRGIKNKPFLLMESSPSATNWQDFAKLRRPGMHKLSSLQAVAHGSDSVQYFQWRKSRGSNEKFHGAVVDHVGNENTRVFREVTEVGVTLEKIEEILGTMPVSRVAILRDTENDWALSVCMGFERKNKKYGTTLRSFYRWFWSRGINVDLVDPHRDLSPYPLVVAPMLYMTAADVIENFEKYVKNGGTLIGTYALGMVNENDLCYLGGFPGGKLKEVFGVWAEEIDTLYPEDRNAVTFAGTEYPVVDYCERIHPAKGAEVLGTYRDDFYAGEPALVRNRYGKGTTYYVAARDTGELKDALLSRVTAELGIKGLLAAPQECVSAHSREDDDYCYLFFENYSAAAKTVDVGAAKYNMETGETESGNVTIPAFGIRIYKEKK